MAAKEAAKGERELAQVTSRRSKCKQELPLIHLSPPVPPTQELIKEALRKEAERFEGKLQLSLDRLRERAEQRLGEELRVCHVTCILAKWLCAFMCLMLI